MARHLRTATVVPGARRLINSLRDLGYDTPEAVADLVDNSIAAGAHRVDIEVAFDSDDSWIRIADDGRGMDGRSITEAMRYGTEREYESDDLGKFGLGLKTASMSQCRVLTVASRTSKSSARIEARQLDLDYVEETNSWDIIIVDAGDRPSELTEPLRSHTGTVVLWQDLDRILTYRDPSGGWAKRYLLELTERIEEHIAMVFHRFLGGEVRGRRLTVTINGSRIEPWDPFARGEAGTEALRAEDFPVSAPGGAGIVRFEPYVLPPKAAFGSQAAWQRSSGPRGWNPQQGFYIYRANRLIQSGGWSRTRVFDEHTKLSRIALLFPPSLDSAFEINVAKMRVSLPAELRMVIQESVDRAVRRARVVYDAKPDGPSPRHAPASATPTAANVSARASASTANPDEVSDSRPAGIRSARRALEDAASAVREVAALDRIVGALEDRNPDIARDLGW